MIKTIGMIAAIALPFWNIPLLLKIRRRKSSRDISLSWALGVLACIFLMLPAALLSSDPIFKAFSLVNALLFSVVTIQVIRYRR